MKLYSLSWNNFWLNDLGQERSARQGKAEEMKLEIWKSEELKSGNLEKLEIWKSAKLKLLTINCETETVNHKLQNH
jgi:hypothetical protein